MTSLTTAGGAAVASQAAARSGAYPRAVTSLTSLCHVLQAVTEVVLIENRSTLFGSDIDGAHNVNFETLRNELIIPWNSAVNKATLA